jgi:hypothetical protein
MRQNKSRIKGIQVYEYMIKLDVEAELYTIEVPVYRYASGDNLPDNW